MHKYFLAILCILCLWAQSVSAQQRDPPPAAQAVYTYPAPWLQDGVTATLAVTGVSANVARPWVAAFAGTDKTIASPVTYICNTGTTTAYVKLGTSNAVVATTADIQVLANGPCSILSTGNANKYIAAITATGTTSLTIANGNGTPVVGGTGSAGGGMTTTAGNAQQPFSYRNIVLGQYNLQYPASAYSGGSCVAATATSAGSWDGVTNHDVGPCINAAIAVAAAAGGGSVIIPASPAGQFYISTSIANHTSGVHLAGAGLGVARDTASPTQFIAATLLKWNGASGSGPALNISPASDAAQKIYSADATGFAVDCGSLLDECIRISDVTKSNLVLGQAEARKTGINITTSGQADSSGNQGNTFDLAARNLNASFCPTGILIDKGAGSSVNSSYSHYTWLSAAYGCGDGVVSGGSDNNDYFTVRGFRYGTATTGSSFVIANSAYVPPSGIPVNGLARAHVVYRAGTATQIQGLQAGATFTPAPSNTGTGAVNTVVISTNALSGGNTPTLNFASTTGIVVGDSINCGGTSSGVYPNTIVTGVTGTTVTMKNNTVIDGGVSGVASGQSCTFTWGVKPVAVAGTYTLTTADGTSFTLTAPSGGHTQSGITVSSSTLSFTDMIIPWTGAAVAGDSWTIVLPSPSVNDMVLYRDADNSISAPHCEYGATGVIPSGSQGEVQSICGIAGASINGPLKVSYPAPNATPTTGGLIVDNPSNGLGGAATQTTIVLQASGLNIGSLRANSTGAVVLNSNNNASIVIGGSDFTSFSGDISLGGSKYTNCSALTVVSNVVHCVP